MVYSVRLTPEQRAAAHSPIMLSLGDAGGSKSLAAQAFRHEPIEFPRIYVSSGRFLPDLRQTGPHVVTDEMLQVAHARKARVMAMAMSRSTPKEEEVQGPHQPKVKKEPSLSTRSRSRTVYVQRRAKRWGKQ